VHLRHNSDATDAAFAHVWNRRLGYLVRCRSALFNPRLDFGKIPDYASRSQMEPPREFTAALHLIDCRIREWDQFSELVATDGALMQILQVMHGLSLT
jgi:hypothetical protein